MARITRTRIATTLHKRWLGNLLFGLLLLCLLGALAGVAIRLQQNLATAYHEIELESRRIASDMDRELEIQSYSVAALGAVADSVLKGALALNEDPVRRLVAVPSRAGYTSQLPPELIALTQPGNITGLGPIPGPGSLAAREMTMAVGLRPLMQAIKQKNPEVPWVYYTSASGFMFLYPHVPMSEFFYRRELETMDFYRLGLPANNPGHQVYWTPLYEDAAGQGQMMTVGRPVYQGERFLGVLSIDLAADQLLRHVRNHGVTHSSLYLYDAQGRPMLDPDGRAPAIDVRNTGAPTSDAQGQRVSVFSLPSARWHLVVRTDHHSMVRSALAKTAFHLATVLLSLVSLLLVAMLMRTGRKIQTLSIRDGLTGLYNRRHFEEVARTEIARCRRHELWLGLMLIDVDFFKKYNDRYGHPMGDAALQDVTTAMRQSLRRATDGLFRVGGEEFAVLVELTGPADLGPLADKLNTAVRSVGRPHEDSPHRVVTISIGTTLIGPGQWVDLERAYKCADEALYEAKQSGRDRHVYRPPV